MRKLGLGPLCYHHNVLFGILFFWQPDATDSAPEAAVADDGDDGDGGDSPPVEEATPQQLMDQLVEFCFFKALKTTAKKVDLPVLTSNFFRLHMVPACPAGRSLDVKKSSHKKLSKFLESVQVVPFPFTI